MTLLFYFDSNNSLTKIHYAGTLANHTQTPMYPTGLIVRTRKNYIRTLIHPIVRRPEIAPEERPRKVTWNWCGERLLQCSIRH